MTSFNVHKLDTAPAASKPFVEGAQKAFGFLPNLVGVLAESPAAIEGYLAVAGAFEKSAFSPTEKQIVLIATSVENGCEYCVAAHTTVGGMQKIPGAILEALREGRALPDEKLEALRSLTVSIVRNRGFAGKSVVDAFFAAGYSKQQLLDVITGVTQKTLSNYVNHIAATPLDGQFANAAWSKDRVTA
jgi:AhpD family alkylhydroperoxidase